MICKVNDENPCFKCGTYCSKAWEELETQVAKEIATWADTYKALKTFGKMF